MKYLRYWPLAMLIVLILSGFHYHLFVEEEFTIIKNEEHKEKWSFDSIDYCGRFGCSANFKNDQNKIAAYEIENFFESKFSSSEKMNILIKDPNYLEAMFQKIKLQNGQEHNCLVHLRHNDKTIFLSKKNKIGTQYNFLSCIESLKK